VCVCVWTGLDWVGMMGRCCVDIVRRLDMMDDAARFGFGRSFSSYKCVCFCI
jgi:hypothetical protein